MASKKIVSKRERTLPTALAFGLLAGVLVTLLGTGLLAYLINRETVEIDGIHFGGVVIHLLGSAVTCLVAYGLMKRQRVVVCALSALCYFLIQLGMTALVFNGQYQGIGSGVLSIVGGGVLSILPGLISRGGGGKRTKLKAFR